MIAEHRSGTGPQESEVKPLGRAIVQLTPLAWVLAGPLYAVGAPVQADAIVVLAGGAGESGIAGQGHEERLARVLELYKKGYARRLLLSSGHSRAFREPELMRAIAISNGVAPESVFVIQDGGSTHRMIADADAWVRERKFSRILLVSSPFHMRRSLLVWRKIDPSLEVVPVPAFRSEFYGYSESDGRRHYPRGASIRQIGGIIREYAAIVYYRLSGRL